MSPDEFSLERGPLSVVSDEVLDGRSIETDGNYIAESLDLILRENPNLGESIALLITEMSGDDTQKVQQINGNNNISHVSCVTCTGRG